MVESDERYHSAVQYGRGVGGAEAVEQALYDRQGAVPVALEARLQEFL